MSYISIDCQYVEKFVNKNELEILQEKVKTCHEQLHAKSGRGNDFLGWLTLPDEDNSEEFQRILQAAEKIRKDSDFVVVIGIGGSYLGAKAGLDFLCHHFYNFLDKAKRKTPQILFAGQNLSAKYMSDMADLLSGSSFSVVVISKSGTTTEPGVAFRFFRKLLEEKYGETASKRVYAITDRERGALKTEAVEKGYEQFIIPDDVGGRYSVLTAVGLLPMAIANINISEMLKGAKLACHELSISDWEKNPAYLYAIMRNALYNSGKFAELLVNYEPSLQYFGEWWKQLFGESEGKEGKGLFPASVNFTTDLHSLGQYIQEGRREIFETILNFESANSNVLVTKEENNLDGLNYLADKSVFEINQKAFEGTLMAHLEGGIGSIVISLPKQDAFTFGYLVYFFMKACAISGYLLEVNPFDQPGVEAYKKKMFALLGKNK